MLEWTEIRTGRRLPYPEGAAGEERRSEEEKSMLKRGERVGIVCCSNGLSESRRGQMERLDRKLLEIGLIPEYGSCMYAGDTVFNGTGRERAADLMRFYLDERIRAIFDVSGGDAANGVLPYLDFPVIGASDKLFWGYSDLTVILNGIFQKTGRPSVLYQVRNLVGEEEERQTEDFCGAVFGSYNGLFSMPCEFLQGTELSGTAVGGNIRCLLKLAGTKFWPDTAGKILILEASGGTAAQMAAFLGQLQLMGVFEKLRGIFLGTFLAMEESRCRPSIEELVLEFAGPRIPVARTRRLGHREDSGAAVIGGFLRGDKNGILCGGL